MHEKANYALRPLVRASNWLSLRVYTPRGKFVVIHLDDDAGDAFSVCAWHLRED